MAVCDHPRNRLTRPGFATNFYTHRFPALIQAWMGNKHKRRAGISGTSLKHWSPVTNTLRTLLCLPHCMTPLLGSRANRIDRIHTRQGTPTRPDRNQPTGGLRSRKAVMLGGLTRIAGNWVDGIEKQRCIAIVLRPIPLIKAK